MPWTGKHDPRYSTKAWREARANAIIAAEGKCQIQGEGCLVYATQVHHIRGLDNDPEHRYLMAACQPCHAVVTAQSGRPQPPADDPDPLPFVR